MLVCTGEQTADIKKALYLDISAGVNFKILLLTWGRKRDLSRGIFRLTYLRALQSRVGGPNAAIFVSRQKGSARTCRRPLVGIWECKNSPGRLRVCVIFKRACERCCFAFSRARRFTPWTTQTSPPLGSWSRQINRRQSSKRTRPEGSGLEISADVGTSFYVVPEPDNWPFGGLCHCGVEKREPPKVNWPWRCLSTTPTTPDQAIVAHITKRGQLAQHFVRF
jgi:hypothetical protein